MARITIDDCTDKIESRFDLVLLASHRARQALEGVSLQAGDSHVKKSEKTTVQALREIADDVITPEELQESLISRMQNERSIQKLVEEPSTNDDANPVASVIQEEPPKLATSGIAKPSTTNVVIPETSSIHFDDDVLDEDAE